MPFFFSLFLCIARMKKSVPLCSLFAVCVWGALSMYFCICALFVVLLQILVALTFSVYGKK